jgi:hypothetical protein
MMFRRLPSLFMVLGATCATAACNGRPADRHTDLQPPPGFTPPPPAPPGKIPLRVHRIFYGEGFFPPERDAAGKSWRWMGRRGVIRLPPAAETMTLRLSGWVPLELLSAAPRVRLTLNQHALDSFVPSMRDLRKEYLIDQGLIAGAARPTLTLEVSEVGQAPGDSRALGLAISSLDWHAASPAAP